MRRLSRPPSSDSPLEPSPQGCLSPVLHADPDPAARTFPDSATPSVLYRSSFAQECEAVAVQLRNAAEEAWPRWTLDIQEEKLTPLEPPCSFLGSSDYGSPSRPVPEPASASVGPPGPSAILPCSEQSTGLAGGSPGGVAQRSSATPSPVSGLKGVSLWPELEKDSPQPSGANVTYECNDSGGSAANATYICTGSRSPGEERTSADSASPHPALEACKWDLSFVTSTPLMGPPLSEDAFPTTLCTGCPGASAGSELDSKQKPPADPPRESGTKVTSASNHRSPPAAAGSGAEWVPHGSGKAPPAKRSLPLGAPRALRARGAPDIGGLPKRTGTTRNIPQPAGGNHLQNVVMPPTKAGSAVQSQPVAQKLLSDERTKTDLTELPCSEKPPISMQPPSRLAGRSGGRGSLACLGLKLHGVARVGNASGTRLPVLAGPETKYYPDGKLSAHSQGKGNKVTTKTSSQKRPWEKSSDKATVSPLKQSFPKRSRLCKSQKEKPACSDLMAVGQTPIAALEKELTAPCSQCQWLAEENQRLKIMLETYQKTITFLEGKQPVVENENCPPQKEAT